MLRPRLLPVAQNLARRALHRGGLGSVWLDTSAGPVHAFDGRGRGSLPPVVMLHGIGSAASAFTEVLLRLRHDVRRVSATEMPGHGFSPQPTKRLTPETLFVAMTEALDELTRDEPVILSGNSLGGAVALRYARDRPERVRGLLLTSPAGARLSEADFRLLVRHFELESTKDARAFLSKLYHRAPWFAPLLAPDFLDVVGTTAVRDILTSASHEDAAEPEDLAALKMPIHFVWGQSERLLPPAAFAYFREHLPKHAVFEEPEAVGHCPHLDDPRGTAVRIVRFARSLQRA